MDGCIFHLDDCSDINGYTLPRPDIDDRRRYTKPRPDEITETIHESWGIQISEALEGSRFCYFLQPVARDKESGEYVALIAVEGRPGYYATDYSCGTDFSIAVKDCQAENKAMGLSDYEVKRIIRSGKVAHNKIIADRQKQERERSIRREKARYEYINNYYEKKHKTCPGCGRLITKAWPTCSNCGLKMIKTAWGIKVIAGRCKRGLQSGNFFREGVIIDV